MSKRRQNLLLSGIRGGRIVDCSNYLHPSLHALRRSIAEDFVDQRVVEQLGFKVWVLPPWYYRLFATRRLMRLALTDLTARLIHWPRLVLVGELTGDEFAKSSGTKWSVGKGVLSRTLAYDSSLGDFGVDDVYVLHHDRDWAEGIEFYPKREIRRLPPEIRLGRVQKDFRRLRDIYGSVIAVSLPARNLTPAIGCLTAHTSRTRSLTDDEAVALADKMIQARESITAIITRQTRYPLPWTGRT